MPGGALLTTLSPTPPPGFAYTGLSFGVGERWGVRPSLPEGPTWAPAVAALDGKLYVIGGQVYDPDRGSWYYTSSTWILDLASGTWTQGSDYPYPTRSEASAVALDGYIYLVGGWTNTPVAGGDTYSLDQLNRYDPLTDEWTEMESMNQSRDACAVAVLDGKIYAAGGYFGSNFGYEYLSSAEVYDPITDLWSDLPELPYVAGWWPVGATVDGKFYVMGGYGGNERGGSIYDQNDVAEYEPVSNTWTLKTPMSLPRDGHVGGALKGRIYVTGGYTGNGYTSTTEEYDPFTDTWAIRASLPRAWAYGGGTVDGSWLFIAGGERPLGSYNSESLDWVRDFTPPTLLYLHAQE